MEAETATTDVPVVQVSEKIEGKGDVIKVMLVTYFLKVHSQEYHFLKWLW